jgi:hypothetical protein
MFLRNIYTVKKIISVQNSEVKSLSCLKKVKTILKMKISHSTDVVDTSEVHKILMSRLHTDRCPFCALPENIIGK